MDVEKRVHEGAVSLHKVLQEAALNRALDADEFVVNYLYRLKSQAEDSDDPVGETLALAQVLSYCYRGLNAFAFCVHRFWHSAAKVIVECWASASESSAAVGRGRNREEMDEGAESLQVESELTKGCNRLGEPPLIVLCKLGEYSCDGPDHLDESNQPKYELNNRTPHLLPCCRNIHLEKCGRFGAVVHDLLSALRRHQAVHRLHSGWLPDQTNMASRTLQRTALHFAAQHGLWQIVAALFGASRMHVLGSNLEAIVSRQLSNQFQVNANAVDRDWNTAFHVVCENFIEAGKGLASEFAYTVVLLLNEAAQVNIENKDGETGFSLCQVGFPSVVYGDVVKNHMAKTILFHTVRHYLANRREFAMQEAGEHPQSQKIMMNELLEREIRFTFRSFMRALLKNPHQYADEIASVSQSTDAGASLTELLREAPNVVVDGCTDGELLSAYNSLLLAACIKGRQDYQPDDIRAECSVKDRAYMSVYKLAKSTLKKGADPNATAQLKSKPHGHGGVDTAKSALWWVAKSMSSLEQLLLCHLLLKYGATIDVEILSLIEVGMDEIILQNSASNHAPGEQCKNFRRFDDSSKKAWFYQRALCEGVIHGNIPITTRTKGEGNRGYQSEVLDYILDKLNQHEPRRTQRDSAMQAESADGDCLVPVTVINQPVVLARSQVKNRKVNPEDVWELMGAEEAPRFLHPDHAQYGMPLDRPLHIAARNGHVDVVRLLCDYGADTLVNNYVGNTPLHVAVEGGHSECVQVLMENGGHAVTQEDVTGLFRVRNATMPVQMLLISPLITSYVESVLNEKYIRYADLTGFVKFDDTRSVTNSGGTRVSWDANAVSSEGNVEIACPSTEPSREASENVGTSAGAAVEPESVDREPPSSPSTRDNMSGIADAHGASTDVASDNGEKSIIETLLEGSESTPFRAAWFNGQTPYQVALQRHVEASRKVSEVSRAIDRYQRHLSSVYNSMSFHTNTKEKPFDADAPVSPVEAEESVITEPPRKSTQLSVDSVESRSHRISGSGGHLSNSGSRRNLLASVFGTRSRGPSETDEYWTSRFMSRARSLAVLPDRDFKDFKGEVAVRTVKRHGLRGLLQGAGETLGISFGEEVELETLEARVNIAREDYSKATAMLKKRQVILDVMRSGNSRGAREVQKMRRWYARKHVFVNSWPYLLFLGVLAFVFITQVTNDDPNIPLFASTVQRLFVDEPYNYQYLVNECKLDPTGTSATTITTEEGFEKFKHTFRDMAERKDFWSWLKGPFRNAIYAPDKSLNGYILEVYRVIGFPRMRQLRVTGSSCDVPSQLSEASPSIVCYDKWSDVEDETTSFSTGSYSWSWNTASSSEFGPTFSIDSEQFYGGQGFVVDIPTDRDSFDTLVTALENNGWVNDQTRAIFLDFGTFNGNINIFHYILFAIEFPPSGGLNPWWIMRAQKLLAPNNAVDYISLIFELVIVVSAIGYLLKELGDIVGSILHGRLRNYLSDPWIFFDWFNIACLCTIIPLRVSAVILTAAEADEFTSQSEHVELNQVTTLYRIQQDIMSLMLLISLFKVLKFLQILDRGGPVISAILKTIRSGDVFTLFCMALAFVTAFAFSFHVQFGSSATGYRTLFSSYVSVGKFLMADYALENLRLAKSPWRAIGGVFFLALLILGVIMGMNMAIAIIVKTFERNMKKAREDWDNRLTAFMQHPEFGVLRVERPSVVDWATGTTITLRIWAIIHRRFCGRKRARKLKERSWREKEMRQLIHQAEEVKLANRLRAKKAVMRFKRPQHELSHNLEQLYSVHGDQFLNIVRERFGRNMVA